MYFHLWGSIGESQAEIDKYHGEFASTLYGEYRNWNTSWHHSEIYTGTFESVSGASLSFDFYFD